MSGSELMEGWRFDARSAAECGNLPVPLCPQGKSSGIAARAEMTDVLPGVYTYPENSLRASTRYRFIFLILTRYSNHGYIEVSKSDLETLFNL